MSANRKDPQSATKTRKDPVHRRIDATDGTLGLRNKDPRLTYIWVAMGSVIHGPDYYEALGYKPVLYEESGVKPVFRASVGEPITSQGLLLMAAPNEIAQSIAQFGASGNGGQELADQYDERLIKDRRRQDLFRGIAPLGMKGYVEESEVSHEVRKG